MLMEFMFLQFKRPVMVLQKLEIFSQQYENTACDFVTVSSYVSLNIPKKAITKCKNQNYMLR